MAEVTEAHVGPYVCEDPSRCECAKIWEWELHIEVTSKMSTQGGEDTHGFKRSTTNVDDNLLFSQRRHRRVPRRRRSPGETPPMHETASDPRRVTGSDSDDSRSDSPIWAAAKALEKRYRDRLLSKKRSIFAGEFSNRESSKKRAVARWNQPNWLACTAIDDMALANVTGLTVFNGTTDRIRFSATLAHDPSSECQMTSIDAFVDRDEPLGKELKEISRQAGEVLSRKFPGTRLQTFPTSGADSSEADSETQSNATSP